MIPRGEAEWQEVVGVGGGARPQGARRKAREEGREPRRRRGGVRGLGGPPREVGQEVRGCPWEGRVTAAVSGASPSSAPARRWPRGAARGGRSRSASGRRRTSAASRRAGTSGGPGASGASAVPSRDAPHRDVPECFGRADCIGCLWRRECEEHRERAERERADKRRKRKRK